MNENKTGKYFKYAIGEIILVVIGILIALQINNWNENRKTRNQELVLLNNLKLEMEENLILLDDYLETKEIAMKNCDILLSYTNPTYVEKKEDSLLSKFTRIFDLDNFKAEIMVLKAAQNSNSIKLISDQQIKAKLSKWEQSLNKQMEFVAFGNEHFSNSLIPLISNYYPLKNIPVEAGKRNEEDLSKHKSELEKMFRSREFENSLFRIRNFEKIRAWRAKELKEYTLNLIELLDKELNIQNNETL